MHYRSIVESIIRLDAVHINYQFHILKNGEVTNGLLLSFIQLLIIFDVLIKRFYSPFCYHHYLPPLAPKIHRTSLTV